MKIKNLILIAVLSLVLMSVQVQAASCVDEIQSEKTMDFMSEIPDLSAKLDGVVCDNKIDYFKNEEVVMKIEMQDGSEQAFTVTTKDGAFVEISNGVAESPSYMVTTGECDFDTLLRATDKGGVFAYLYKQKRIDITAFGLLKKIGLFFKKMVLGIAMGKIQVLVDITCTTG